MPRFLIEVPHEPTPLACIRAIEAVLRSGSHFLTHADWGCKDGEHKAWIIMELDSKDAARQVVPADYRAQARVVQLTHFTLDQMAASRHRLEQKEQGQGGS